MRRFSRFLAVVALAPAVFAAVLLASDALAVPSDCCPDEDASAASTVVYVEGDAGVAIRGDEAVPHLDGAPAADGQVEPVGHGFRLRDANGDLRAEVALRDGPDGLRVDWVWAPRPYYAVTFPAFGVRVSGRDGESGLRITDVTDGTPAASVGLQPWARLLEVDGRAATPLALRAALDRTASGTGAVVLRIVDLDSANPYTVVVGPNAYMPK